jgi:hypothetical protein
MDNAAAGGHPVHRPGPDRLRIAQAVAVQDFSVEQIGDRGEADMQVRPHVETPALAQYHRAHLVEEHERPHYSALRRWQRSVHFETVAKISGARHDHAFERGIPRVACHVRSLPGWDKFYRWAG